MSVSIVDLHSQGASGTATGTDTGDVSASYRSAYRVTVDDPLDQPDLVLAHFRGNADLPWPGRAFKFGNGFDATVFCKTIDADFVEHSAGQFVVRCTFSSQQNDEKQDGQTPDGKTSQDPTQWHDEIDVSYTQVSIPVERATFQGFLPDGINNTFLQKGKVGPIVNSALCVYDPTLEEEIDIKVLRITKYLKAYDGATFGKFQGAVNSDEVSIVKSAYKFKESFGKYQGFMRANSAQFAITNGKPHYRQTIEVHIHPLENGWRRLVVDRGLDARRAAEDPDGKGGTISNSDVADAGAVYHEPIKDKEGYAITEPVLLDGNGQPLKVTSGMNPVYLIYSTKKEMAFAGIQW